MQWLAGFCLTWDAWPLPPVCGVDVSHGGKVTPHSGLALAPAPQSSAGPTAANHNAEGGGWGGGGEGGGACRENREGWG